MTSRGFDTKAAARTPLGGHGHGRVAPVEPAIDAHRARGPGGARGVSSRPPGSGRPCGCAAARPAGGRARGPARAGPDAGDRAGRAGAAHDSPAGAHAVRRLSLVVAVLLAAAARSGRWGQSRRELHRVGRRRRCRPRSPARPRPRRRGPRSWSSAPTAGQGTVDAGPDLQHLLVQIRGTGAPMAASTRSARYPARRAETSRGRAASRGATAASA